MQKFHPEVYEEDFFNHLLKNSDLKKEIEAMGAFFIRPLWWFVRPFKKKKVDFKEIGLTKCGFLRKGSSRAKGKCFAQVLSALKRAKRTRRLQKFECENRLSGFCLPVIQGDKLYGYIGMCHLDAEVPRKPLGLFVNFVHVVIKDIQKELELSKLYETIRPRAIALSTVHTIHRLISSTLDMDELLPRIARLCLQVVQANRCSLKLLDKERKTLVPVITIDLRTKRRLNPKELKVGKGVPGRAVKAEKILRGHNFLSVPLIDEEAMGVITVYDKVNKKAFTQFDQEIMMTIAEQAVIAIKNAQMYEEQENLAISSIKSLATILDTRGKTGFIPRTAFINIVLEIGKEIGMGQMELRSLHYAALLHDAGQLFIPDDILAKPTKLTGEEYNLIKEHPAKGVEMIKPTKYLKPVIPIILHHHECYDGTGYPGRLKADEIPIGARIMAVVSAFLAMITPKSYRVTRTIEEAQEEIKRNSGTQFDPKVVEVFLKVLQRADIKELIEKEYNRGVGKAVKGQDIF